MTYKIQSKTSIHKVLRIVLLFLGLAFVLLATMLSWVLLILSIYFIVMILFVKDKELVVYDDRFELHGKSIISQLSSKEVFYYKDIEKIQYDKSFTNLISEIIGNAAWSPSTSSKPDTIEIYKNDGSIRIINRIGDRQEFENAFLYIFDMQRSNIRF